jgi:hypothetical protein
VKHRAPLERDIQQSICEYLTARRHFFWRNNTGAAKLEGGPVYPLRHAKLAGPDRGARG